MKDLFFYSILSLLFFSSLHAQDIPCDSAELNKNFPDAYVNYVLEFYNIPKNKWKFITDELASKEGSVQQIVKDKAAEMSPNPLTPPVESVTVSRLYRETIYDIFSSTLKDNEIESETTIRDMFSRILDMKGKRFWECEVLQNSKR
jgi:hypothetical protein